MQDSTQGGEDTVGAFIPGPRQGMEPIASGPLSGLDFAAKDLFDVAGQITSYGNPDWARTHAPAVASAPIVTALLRAGARLAGKTKTVELAFGLTGENVWHGTPLNPATPDRFPGGSSCGSAAAVAAGLVDFALGSDTGGSVRIPASYCGLFGIRPSTGAISLAGACPLAPVFDTPGWFTRGAGLLARVGGVLLPASAPLAGPLLKVAEVWAHAETAVAAALAPALEKLANRFGQPCTLRLAPEGLRTLHDHYRAIQSQEAWAALGGWISAEHPAFGPAVGERFAAAAAMPEAAASAARAFRKQFQARLIPLLAGGAVLVFPTSPCLAPLLTSSTAEQDAVRVATISVTAIAGLAGLPEVTLPAGSVGGAPVGLSLVAAPGRDLALLDFARTAADALGLPA